jgi:hypothetical protein
MLAANAEGIPYDAPENWEVRFWSTQLHGKREAPRPSVREAGSEADDIAARLRKAARAAFRMGGED